MVITEKISLGITEKRILLISRTGYGHCGQIQAG
jgi:hypothetical protein